jgi:hypothetical protein
MIADTRNRIKAFSIPEELAMSEDSRYHCAGRLLADSAAVGHDHKSNLTVSEFALGCLLARRRSDCLIAPRFCNDLSFQFA